MGKALPQPKTDLEIARLERELHMSRKEAMDILLKICAESKAQIRKGQCFTIEESIALLEKQKME